MNDAPPPALATSPPPARSRRREGLSWLLTLGGLAALGAYLALSPAPSMPTTANAASTAAVGITEQGQVLVPAEGPFAASLRRVVVQPQDTTFPLVAAIGTLVAMPDGEATAGQVRWRFATPELLLMHTELTQLANEIEFHQRHLESTVALHAARLQAQAAIVERQRRLVETGTETPRELAANEEELLERRLNGDRARHEAESELRAAQRRRAGVVQQFELAGLSPDLLEVARHLVVAEIPEVHAGMVRTGQACSLRFFGAPGQDRSGRLLRIMPTLATTQHTVRVVVALDQSDARLRAGMFADVDIGCDRRQALFVAATALVHVGRADYVLVGAATELRIAAVQLGETHDGQVEITSGIAAGDAVLTDGALLLKPLVVRALARTGSHR